MTLCICMFPRICVSFAYIGLTFFGLPIVVVFTLKNSPGVGVLCVWMFDVDCVTVNSG